MIFWSRVAAHCGCPTKARWRCWSLWWFRRPVICSEMIHIRKSSKNFPGNDAWCLIFAGFEARAEGSQRREMHSLGEETQNHQLLRMRISRSAIIQKSYKFGLVVLVFCCAFCSKSLKWLYLICTAENLCSGSTCCSLNIWLRRYLSTGFVSKFQGEDTTMSLMRLGSWPSEVWKKRGIERWYMVILYHCMICMPYSSTVCS